MYRYSLELLQQLSSEVQQLDALLVGAAGVAGEVGHWLSKAEEAGARGIRGDPVRESTRTEPLEDVAATDAGTTTTRGAGAKGKAPEANEAAVAEAEVEAEAEAATDGTNE